MPIEAARLQVVTETKGVQKTVRDLKSVEGAVKSTESGINQLGAAGERLGRAGGFLPGLANVAQVINALPAVGQLAHAVVSPLMDAAEQGVKFNAWLETTKIGLDTLLGSAEKAQEHLDLLAAFAERTPFQFQDLVKASQRMQAYGFEASRVVPIMRDVGDAVSSTGDISKEVFDGIIVALGQMRAKGKVSAEEMEQLAERGIPAWELLAKAIGKSVAETRRLSEAGRLRGGPAVDAMLEQIRLRYGGQMSKLNNTLTGRMSNLEDIRQRAAGVATQNLTRDLNDMLAEALTKQDLATQLATSINTAITPVGAIVKGAAHTLIAGNVAGGFRDGIDATKSVVTTAMSELGLGAIFSLANTLGIHSPSVEMYKLGVWAGKGFVLGLRDSMQEGEGVPNDYLTYTQRQTQARYRYRLRTDKKFAGFEQRLAEVSRNLGIDPNWLLNVIGVETGGTFDPAAHNRNGDASGLIQFMPKTARHLGTDVDSIRKMSATAQLDLVQKYFEMMGASGRMQNLADVYNVVAGNWKPGGGPDTVVYRQGSKEYAANYKVWDKYRDGVITKSELGEVAYDRGGGFGSPIKVEVVNGREVWGASNDPARDTNAPSESVTTPPLDSRAADTLNTVNDAAQETVSTTIELTSVLIPHAIQATNDLGEAALNSANAVQEQTKSAAEWYKEIVTQSEESTRRLKVQWDDVASGFEGVFSDATDRWLQDGDNFFRAFSLGFARLILDLSKQALAANLSKLLFGYNGQQGSAGGGWLGRLIGWGVSAIGSAFGGAALQHFGPAANAFAGPSVGNIARGVSGSGSLPWLGGGVNPFAGSIPFRASGGDVYAGKAHWVGETGRELYVPQRNGRIFNERQLAGMGGQMTNHFNFHVVAPGGDLPRSTQDQLSRRMLDALTHLQQRGG